MPSNKNKFIIYSIFIFSILIFYFCYNFTREINNINNNNNSLNEKPLKPNGGNLGDFTLLIDDKDSNFNWNKTAFEYDWCYGNGTLENPYIIENITFRTESPNKSIIIKNSLVYFIVRNCIFNDCFEGIEFFNVSNGLILNNLFLNTDITSIFFDACFNITLSANNLTQVGYEGIACEQSKNITIINNKIDTFYGMNYGLYCYNLTYSKIMNNTIKFTGGYNKIGLFFSDHNYLYNNSLLSSGGDGIHIYESENNIISNNLIKDCTWGMFLERNSNYNLIVNNIIKQRDTGIRISPNCNFNSITNNTLEFKDVNRPSSIYNGIEICSSNNNNITFNSIGYYYYGISLCSSNFSYVHNNTLYKNFKACIYENDCIGNVILNNNCIPNDKITGFNYIILLIILLTSIIFIKKKKKIVST